MFAANIFYTRSDQGLHPHTQNIDILTLAPVAAPFCVLEPVKAVAELLLPVAGKGMQSDRLECRIHGRQELMNALHCAAFSGPNM